MRVSKLKLYKNAIGNAGAAAVAGYISKTAAAGCLLLEELHLSHCDISNSGAVLVLDAVASAQEQEGGQHVYPRMDARRKAYVPLWLRMEYNTITDPLITCTAAAAAAASGARMPARMVAAATPAAAAASGAAAPTSGEKRVGSGRISYAAAASAPAAAAAKAAAAATPPAGKHAAAAAQAAAPQTLSEKSAATSAAPAAAPVGASETVGSSAAAAAAASSRRVSCSDARRSPGGGGGSSSAVSVSLETPELCVSSGAVATAAAAAAVVEDAVNAAATALSGPTRTEATCADLFKSLPLYILLDASAVIQMKHGKCAGHPQQSESTCPASLAGLRRLCSAGLLACRGLVPPRAAVGGALSKHTLSDSDISIFLIIDHVEREDVSLGKALQLSVDTLKTLDFALLWKSHLEEVCLGRIHGNSSNCTSSKEGDAKSGEGLVFMLTADPAVKVFLQRCAAQRPSHGGLHDGGDEDAAVAVAASDRGEAQLKQQHLHNMRQIGDTGASDAHPNSDWEIKDELITAIAIVQELATRIRLSEPAAAVNGSSCIGDGVVAEDLLRRAQQCVYRWRRLLLKQEQQQRQEEQFLHALQQREVVHPAKGAFRGE
ncbi:hypothetical protein cyc_08083 [Cyclospora cayetanensis]|uniref:Uncharacterized protein n=1 Tax=Cyclospora cayetanensis TaxID=88456 RepID=A0A1D3CUY1_9EIME|nr:hypothetical protein cyc_08083 [Cyclospora cayetanensis]